MNATFWELKDACAFIAEMVAHGLGFTMTAHPRLAGAWLVELTGAR